MTVYIYTLSDPRTNEVRYVGKTVKTLSHRLNNHIYDAPRFPSHRSSWIVQLSRIGLRPIISMIDKIENSDDTDWQAREVFWIAHYRRIGAPLTNLDSGGRRGKCMTEASKEKCRISSTGRKHSEEAKAKIRAWNLGRKMSAESVEKTRAANLGRKQSPETIAKLTALRTGRKRSEQTRLKISAALKGKKRTPETLLRMSRANLGKKLSEETKMKISKGLYKHYAA